MFDRMKSLLLGDEIHFNYIDIKLSAKNCMLGCVGIVIIVGVGVVLAEKKKKELLWRKSLCINKQYQNLLYAKLQKLDEDDVSTNKANHVVHLLIFSGSASAYYFENLWLVTYLLVVTGLLNK